MADETTTRRTPTPALRRDRQPRPPGQPWLNPHADRQLRTDLGQLPDLVALVAANPTPLHHGAPGPRPAPGSRPPVSLATVALTDRRTRNDDVDVIGLADLERTAGRRDGIEPTIRAWLLLAEGEMFDDGVQPAPIPQEQQLADDCAWLARHIVWITEQQWAHEFADVVRRAVRDCEAHLHIRPTYRPHCQRQGCGGRLRDEGAVWRCDTCLQDVGDGRLTLRQVVAQQEPMTVGELVRAFGWCAKTVESWVRRGQLAPVDPDTKPRRFHVMDAVRLADANGAHSAG